MRIRLSRKELAEHYRPGIASDYIRDVSELIKAKQNLAIVLYCRVSTPSQKKHLVDMQQELRNKLKHRQVTIVGCVSEVANASNLLRDGLRESISLARKKEAIIVAESADRFIRNSNYNPKYNCGCAPTISQYKQLASISKGVILATLLHPDAKDGTQRGCHITRGMRLPSKRGGRKPQGYKKQRRLINYPKVIWMKRVRMSLRKIGAALHITHSTIQSWEE